MLRMVFEKMGPRENYIFIVRASVPIKSSRLHIKSAFQSIISQQERKEKKEQH